MSHSTYRSWHVLTSDSRATSVKVNWIWLLLVPGLGIAGYVWDGWPGALTAEGLWAGVVLAATLINWLPHPEETLDANQLNPHCDRNEWLDRFSLRLQELRPSMSFPQAAKFAVGTWREAADLEPEKAAEIYAAE